MRILILTQFFDPEPNLKGLLFARELVAEGHDVEVLTGFPNYPGGKLYDGYKVKLRQIEHRDGVRIVRVPLYPSHDNSVFRRSLNYISFAASATFYGLLFSRKFDVLYVYHPPLTVAIAGSIVALLRRAPLVLDIQDIWPDTLAATGMINGTRVLRMIGRVCQWVYRRADRVVVISPGFEKLLLSRNVSKRKVTVIYNWCEERILSGKVGRSEEILPHGFNVVFAGNIGKAQALRSVLDAAALIESRGIAANFIIVGAGVEKRNLCELVQQRHQENVFFLPWMVTEKIGGILVQADALLVHLKKDPLFEITVPSKTQAYLAIGKPIIMAVDGDAGRLVEDAKAGIHCSPEDPEALADAVENLFLQSPEERRLLGENGQQFYYSKLCLKVGVRRFLDIFSDVTEAGTRGRLRG